MPDHEFEKQIQEKMGELRLSPSAPVWDRVEQQLNKNDKRRRGLLWIPVFLAAAVAIFILVNRSVEPADEKADTVKPVAEAKRHPQVDKQIRENIDTARIHEEDGVIKNPLSNIDTAAGVSELDKNKPVSPATGFEKGRSVASAVARRKPTTVTVEKAAGMRSYDKEKLTTVEGYDDLKTTSIPEEIETVGETERMLTPSRVTSQPSNFQKISIWKEMIMPDFKPTEMKRAARKNTPVEFGLSASFGRSHITNGQFSQLLTNASALSTAADRGAGNFGAAGPGPVAPIYIPPSRLKAGAAFTAGGYVKKQLTRAFWLSTGLNYKLYATVNTVGLAIDTFMIQNNSTSPVVLHEVYNAGNVNRHTNYFHFIEIPLAAEGRLLNGKLPLSWNAGVSYSRLIASNALHYDSRYRVYHNQNSLLQKNQLNLHAAVTTKLFLASREPLVVGPEFSYSMSNLLKANSGNAKHFMFVGVKTSISIN